ncbi:putative E3 ubiquitin-protein ligase ATL44 [Phlyctochytrium bullatum]|nr:putative E3 ubiquitin-protein ligase ATL44 [Phlyctochytrium bullatum]
MSSNPPTKREARPSRPLSSRVPSPFGVDSGLEMFGTDPFDSGLASALPSSSRSKGTMRGTSQSSLDRHGARASGPAEAVVARRRGLAVSRANSSGRLDADIKKARNESPTSSVVEDLTSDGMSSRSRPQTSGDGTQGFTFRGGTPSSSMRDGDSNRPRPQTSDRDDNSFDFSFGRTFPSSTILDLDSDSISYMGGDDKPNHHLAGSAHSAGRPSKPMEPVLGNGRKPKKGREVEEDVFFFSQLAERNADAFSTATDKRVLQRASRGESSTASLSPIERDTPASSIFSSAEFMFKPNLSAATENPFAEYVPLPSGGDSGLTNSMRFPQPSESTGSRKKLPKTSSSSRPSSSGKGSSSSRRPQPSSSSTTSSRPPSRMINSSRINAILDNDEAIVNPLPPRPFSFGHSNDDDDDVEVISVSRGPRRAVETSAGSRIRAPEDRRRNRPAQQRGGARPRTSGGAATGFDPSTTYMLEAADVAIIEEFQQEDAVVDLDSILAAQLQREEEERLMATLEFSGGGGAGPEMFEEDEPWRYTPPGMGRGPQGGNRRQGNAGRLPGIGMFNGRRLPSLPQSTPFGFDDETPVDRLLRRLRGQAYLEGMHREMMGGEEGDMTSAEMILRLMEAQTVFGSPERPDGELAAIMEAMLGNSSPGGGIVAAGGEDEAAATYESLLTLAEELGPAVSKGASAEAIARLPRRKLAAGDTLLGGAAKKSSGKMKGKGPAGSGEEAQSCAICLDEFGLGDEVLTVTGCSHQFHVECGEKWFAVSKQCPTCRVDFTEFR